MQVYIFFKANSVFKIFKINRCKFLLHLKWQIIIFTKFYLKNIRGNNFKTAHNHHFGGSYPTDCLK